MPFNNPPGNTESISVMPRLKPDERRFSSSYSEETTH